MQTKYFALFMLVILAGFLGNELRYLIEQKVDEINPNARVILSPRFLYASLYADTVSAYCAKGTR